MSNVIDFILTNAASELIQKVLSGKTLNFTRMAVGDGFSYDLTAAKSYTTLVNEVLSLDITKKETLSPSSVKITSAFKNTDAQKEFYYREVGLYAQDPDTGKEVLYAYGNRNDAAELITPAGSNIVTKQLIFIISVGDSANITFNVNADVYALQEDMLNVQANKADKNLANTGMITNCLLEVPQRIKAEIVNGTFVLKAGSVVTVPNGDGIFDELVISADQIASHSGNGSIFIFATLDGKCNCRQVHECSSGTSDPGKAATAYYNTESNILNYYYATGTQVQSSFPLAICTVNGNMISSIDQVFNGMGYIGSTIFALPGIKGVVPNGKNPDETFKNVVTTSNGVFIFNFATEGFTGQYIVSLIDNTSTGFTGLESKAKHSTYYQNERPQGIDKWWYHISENQWKYIHNNGEIVNYWWLDVGECNLKNSVITSLTPYTTFQAINKSSDKGWLSSLSMPSEKYTDYELGERGSTHIAPANGYFAIRKVAGIVNGSFTLAVWDSNGTDEFHRTTMFCPLETGEIAFSVPILRGQTVAVDYDATGKTEYFRFIYAQGEVNLKG